MTTRWENGQSSSAADTTMSRAERSDPTPLPALYLDLCRRIAIGEHFTFMRLGDGDWRCLLGDVGENCDKSPYYPDLGAHLQLIVASKPKYIMGMQSMALRLHGKEINGWLEENGIEIPWVDADIFHTANSAERLATFWQAMKGARGVIVGPPWLEKVANKRQCKFIEIPPAIAWRSYDSWAEQVYRTVSPDDVVIVCAGMPGKVLIDDLHYHHPIDLTIVDMGSALDYEGGRLTRRYHKVMWEQDGAKGELCELQE